MRRALRVRFHFHAPKKQERGARSALSGLFRVRCSSLNIAARFARPVCLAVLPGLGRGVVRGQRRLARLLDDGPSTSRSPAMLQSGATLHRRMTPTGLSSMPYSPVPSAALPFALGLSVSLPESRTTPTKPHTSQSFGRPRKLPRVKRREDRATRNPVELETLLLLISKGFSAE